MAAARARRVGRPRGADITPDGDAVRLVYGHPAGPVLELEPLSVVDFLSVAGP